MPDRFHVAYCFDGAYALLTGVSLTSLLHNNPGHAFHVHCLVGEMAAEERLRLETTARRYGATLDFIPLDDGRLATLPLAGHLSSPMIYSRFLLPALLPSTLDRVLYLDSDTLILGDIRELFHCALGTHCVAAVPDPAHRVMGKRFGLPPGAYVNAGVQLMNLPRWRETDLGNRCIAAMQQPDAAQRFAAMDQDVLNVQLNGDFLPLSADDNYCLYHKGEATILGERHLFPPPPPGARILQFLGRVKPHMRWYDGPGLREFERYLTMSEWHDVPLRMPVTVDDLTDLADKLVRQGEAEQAVEYLKDGLATLASRLAQSGGTA